MLDHENSVIKECNKCRQMMPHPIRIRRRKGRKTPTSSVLHMCNQCWITYRNLSKRKRQVAVKRKCIAYLGGVCKSCGLRDDCPDVYDFHHRDPATKSFSVSQEIQRRCVYAPVIQEELDKCDLLCANCHRRFHHAEWQTHHEQKEREFYQNAK